MNRYKGFLLKNQKGDLLVDGLIAMFICSLLAISLSLGVSNTFLQQARTDAQNDAINQIRSSILQIGVDNICNGVKLPNVVLKNKQSLPVETDCAVENIVVGTGSSSYNIAVRKGSLSVTSEQYFGPPGTLVVEL